MEVNWIDRREKSYNFPISTQDEKNIYLNSFDEA